MPPPAEPHFQRRIICRLSTPSWKKAVIGLLLLSALFNPLQLLPVRGQEQLPQADLKVDLTHGACILHAGTKLNVAILTPFGTASSTGTQVKALLTEPICIADLTLADSGSVLSGWVTVSQQPRTAMRAKLPSHHWLNTTGLVSVHFDRLETTDGRVIEMDAGLAPGTPIVQSDATSPPNEKSGQQTKLIVDKQGAITVEFHTRRYAATALGIEAVGWATGPFKLITGPALSAATGAIDPSYSLDRPITHPDALQRTGGFFMGVVKGLPGGFLITGLANHGLPFSVKEGSELQIELLSDLVCNAEKLAARRISATPTTQR